MTTPSLPAAALARGRSLLEAGRVEDAHRCALEATRLYAGDADIWCLLSQTWLALGDAAGALRALGTAVDCAPQRDDIDCMRVDVLRRSGRIAEARELLADLGRRHRHSVHVEYQLARLAEAERRPAEAATHYRRALQRAPTFLGGWINLAAVLGEVGDFAAAVAAGRRAVALAPTFVPGHVNLASSLASLQRYGEALEVLATAASLAPHDLQVRFDIAQCRFSQGDLPGTVAQLERVLEADPGRLEPRSLLLLALLHMSDDGARIDAAHRRFSDAAGAQGPLPWRGPRRPDAAPLRVGLVCADFRVHSLWYFLAPLLDGFTAAGLQLHCYHTDWRADAVTDVWRRRATRWIDAAGMDDEALARQIGADELDALFCLGGHTTASRPGLFARRLAPVQIGFLGYPVATGLANLDFRITDRWADPPGTTRVADRERPVRLRHSYFCFRPMTEPELEHTGRPDDPPTFGCFNVLQKISDRTLSLWASVLNECPAARLVLKCAGLGDAGGQRLLERLGELGVHARRVEFLDRVPTREAHLSMYRRIDVALDTYPYNGATTTCEALWMGVPVISLYGQTPASRMGLSILSAADCAGWAVPSEREFRDVAVALARDVAARRRERAALRDRLRRAPLMNEAVYVDDFLAALRSCLREAPGVDTGAATEPAATPVGATTVARAPT